MRQSQSLWQIKLVRTKSDMNKVDERVSASSTCALKQVFKMEWNGKGKRKLTKKKEILCTICD